MNDIENASAEVVAWEAPGGLPMSLVRREGGTLMVSVKEGAVTIHGTSCLYVVGVAGREDKRSAERLLAEIHLTVSLARCQIVWHQFDAA